MKFCICCGASAEDNALTCANCGEGSWAPIVETKPEPRQQPQQQGKRR